MNTTQAVIEKFFAALPSPGYDLGVLSERGMYRLEAVPHDRIMCMLDYLKRRNADGAHVYLRPTGESAYTLLDDLTPSTLSRLTVEGYGPAAVVETSPGNFQAWIRHGQPLAKELGTLAARVLAVQFGADTGAADWRRFGRAPGFANCKPQHRTEQGLYPIASLISHSGEPFAAAPRFTTRLLSLHNAIQGQRASLRQSYAAQPSRIVTGLNLSRFRLSARYQGRPAAADLAFSIAACSQGWSEGDIAAALSSDYLSRDTSQRRKASYIKRTLSKALQSAA